MTPQTFIYKSADGCDIRADVYAPAAARHPAPAILWLHGGALIWGSCSYMVRPEQIELYTRAGYVFVAIDYRLAPESKLPDILADVQDGMQWVRERGARDFGVDPRRLALVGHSAGGYLALLAGVHAPQPPSCIVSLYGYGDLAAPCYTTPSAFHRQRPLIAESEARAAIGDHPLSAADRHRSIFYGYCRQQGIWPREVIGLAPQADAAALAPWCPERRVHARFPPTLLLHGTDDTDVPHALSASMARALDAAGIENRLITLRGFGHVFDDEFDHPDVSQAFQAILEFLDTHLAC